MAKKTTKTNTGKFQRNVNTKKQRKNKNKNYTHTPVFCFVLLFFSFFFWNEKRVLFQNSKWFFRKEKQVFETPAGVSFVFEFFFVHEKTTNFQVYYQSLLLQLVNFFLFFLKKKPFKKIKRQNQRAKHSQKRKTNEKGRGTTKQKRSKKSQIKKQKTKILKIRKSSEGKGTKENAGVGDLLCFPRITRERTLPRYLKSFIFHFHIEFCKNIFLSFLFCQKKNKKTTTNKLKTKLTHNGKWNTNMMWVWCGCVGLCVSSQSC